MNQTSDSETPEAPQNIFPPRFTGRFLYRGKPTVLIAGDRVCFTGSTITFLRHTETLEMELPTGRIDDKHDLSAVPNSIVATHLAELLGIVLSLEVKKIRHDDRVITFEFS